MQQQNATDRHTSVGARLRRDDALGLVQSISCVIVTDVSLAIPPSPLHTYYDDSSQFQQPMPHPAFVKGYPDAPTQQLQPGPQLDLWNLSDESRRASRIPPAWLWTPALQILAFSAPPPVLALPASHSRWRQRLDT